MARSDILPMTHAKYNEQLFRSAAFSDCTIRCQNRLWHLHRAILSPRCEFFWKCFDGPWEEESSATIAMHDDDPDMLERMLRWIYTLEWPTQKSDVDIWTSDLMLYVLADKYGLSALMDQARGALVQTADTCSDLYRKADSDFFVEHIDDFVDMLRWLFDELPDREDFLSLRRDLLCILAPMMAKHLRSQPQLGDLMTAVPEFGVEFVEALAKPSSGEYCARSCLDGSVLYERSGSATNSVNGSSRGVSPRKLHIPMNEESEDEFD